MIRKFLVEQARAAGFDQQPLVKAMVAEARRVVLADAWFAQLINDVVVAPDQAVLDDYYQKNIADYQFPAQVNMSQLLIGRRGRRGLGYRLRALSAVGRGEFQDSGASVFGE